RLQRHPLRQRPRRERVAVVGWMDLEVTAAEDTAGLIEDRPDGAVGVHAPDAEVVLACLAGLAVTFGQPVEPVTFLPALVRLEPAPHPAVIGLVDLEVVVRA